MTLALVQEALKDINTITNNSTIYTNVVSSTANLLNDYSSIIDDFHKKNRVSVYSIEKYKKKKITHLIDQIKEYASLFKDPDSKFSIQKMKKSNDVPISEPLETIEKSMNSIHSSFKSLGIEVPKFELLDSDLSDDLISFYQTLTANENKEESSQRIEEVKKFMKDHDISLPSSKDNKFSIEDFFSDISKFKLDPSCIQKGKLVISKPEGDYFKGVYTKNDRTRKVTIMEIPEFNVNHEIFQREVTSLSSITHPNIIEFIGATLTPPYWIVTARHGRTLRYYLEHEKKEKIKKSSSQLLTDGNEEKDKNKDKDPAYHKSLGTIPFQPSSFSIDSDEDDPSKFSSKTETETETDTDTDTDNDNKKKGNESKKKHKKNILTGLQKSIIAYKVAEAMSYVHSKNILHRNLSCNTVVLDKAKNPYIIDFGTSRLFPEDESLLLTVGVGTELAKAPELENDTRYGYEIDVFSYGMMLYEMLTCHIAYEKMSPSEAAAAIVSGKRPEIPENAPKKLADLITRCWSPNVKERPSFIQLVNEIPYSKIMFPGSNEDEVEHFYRSVSVKSSNIQYCIDFLEQIIGDINDVVVFKHECARIRALLSRYILALKESKVAKKSEDDVIETDINNLMDALSRLSIGIKNIMSPTWENHALNIPATAPIDDIIEALDSLVVPLGQLGLNVEKYKSNQVDLSLDYRVLYSTFKSNDSIGNSSIDKRIKEVEKFMKKHDITVAPTQHEIDERISSIFKNYDNYIVKHSDYDKKKLIGSGVTSDVYLGIEKSTKRKVAIKEFKEDYLLAEKCGLYLHREIAALSTLHHKYLANFIGTTKTNPIWMISEYIENGDLESHIEKGNLTPIQKTIIMYEVAEGMEYLQSMKMIHRDLKSKNILLDENLEPKIVDFGFTRPFSTIMSVAVGTPIYMAPEVIQSSYYDYKADVFSFALMVSEMITGFKPFLQYCNDPLTIQQYIIDGLRPTFDEDLGVSDDMKDLLEEMWNGEYKERPGFDTILQIMREKKIAFPGATEEEVNEFYEKKEKLLSNSKTKKSLVLPVQ